MAKKIILANFWRNGTQNYFVVEHLNIKGSITQVEAETVYKIRRLASRISEINKDLRSRKWGSGAGVQDHLHIECDIRYDLMGQRYGKYSVVFK
jgi:hypothetical protein